MLPSGCDTSGVACARRAGNLTISQRSGISGKSKMLFSMAYMIAVLVVCMLNFLSLVFARNQTHFYR